MNAICRQKTGPPQKTALFFSPRRTPRRMLPHLPSRRSECTASGTPKAEHSNACPVSCHRQQRGGEHSRSYSKTSITASQRIWMPRHTVPGTTRPLDTLPPHKLSPKTAPACRPPKGRHAARSRMSVLASCGSHPSCRCVRLVWRPQAGCVDRATGLVALLPFHVPAVPFAAAGIPPHCSVAAACPCVFPSGQAAQRCALRAPRL